MNITIPCRKDNDCSTALVETRNGESQLDSSTSKIYSSEVEFHKHCQKTILSASGYNQQGATWNTIDRLSLSNLDQSWKTFFIGNKNITDDLAGILKLINQVSGGIKQHWVLKFNDNHNREIASSPINPWDDIEKTYSFDGFGRDVSISIDGQNVTFNTMTKSQSDVLSVTLPRKTATFKHGNQELGSINVVGMDENTTITIPTPESPSILDAYPVGSIYITMSSEFDPNEVFGGTWVRIGKGKCLWGCDPEDENDVSKIGHDIEPGLPNIRGGISGGNELDMYDSAQQSAQEYFGGQSALYPSDFSHPGENIRNKITTSGTTDNLSGNDFELDASRYNSIYGNSDTVQPPSIGVIFWNRTE